MHRNPFRARPAVLFASLGAVIIGLSCTPKHVAPPPVVVKDPPVVTKPVVAETVTVRDPEQDRRIARLELQLWDLDAQGDQLQQRLDEARDEVARAMAKLQTLATRAEAGSAMAEADVALQEIRGGGQQVAESRQAAGLMQRSTAEFNKQNYGGALYLAQEAKKVATQGQRRLGAAERGTLRAGEVLFAGPVALQATGRANVREGPATNFPVVFTAESGTSLTGISYSNEWVRVSDDSGRTGWVNKSLLSRK